MRTVTPMRETLFDRKIAKDSVWKEAYEAVCKAYKNLQPNFEIKFDNFGGYRLMYTGKSTVQPPTILRRVPIGFVRAVPEGAVTDLSVMSSTRTNEQLLLLGPLRFANSDCSPNCEYDFSSLAGIVELKVKRRLLPGDEILVKYGPEFFEFQECKCRTCWLQQRDEICNDTFYSLTDALLSELTIEVYAELSSDAAQAQQTAVHERSLSPSLPHSSKRRRLRGFDLLAEINSYELDPVDDASYDLALENLPEQHELLPRVNETNLNEQDSLGNESSVEISFNSEDESLCNSLDETVPIDDGIRISTPLPLIVPSLFNPQLSSITQDETRFEDQQQHKASKEALFSGSSVSLDDAASLVEMFCCRFHLSDEGSSALHSLISNLLPSDNLLPSGFRHIQKIKRNFSDNVRHILTTEDYCVCVLKFRFQLRDVVQRNLNQIFNYSDYRRNHPN